MTPAIKSMISNQACLNTLRLTQGRTQTRVITQGLGVRIATLFSSVLNGG